ncbi:MAG TPA: FtsX-like permease family protein, partial [Candidatus Saccharimonadales bacterium]|nr:FtsX-like permease family protein [Candidatus Saccharimonadales bacterium]
RTSAEKQAEAMRIENEKKLGTYIEPAHRTVSYQIVGIMNAEPHSEYGTDVQSFLKNLLSAQDISSTAYVPRQMYDALPDSLKLPVDPANETARSRAAQIIEKAGLGNHVVAFSTIDQARSFINTETCPSSSTECEKLFTSDTYGSNYLILGDIGSLFRKLLVYALPVVLALAALIIWFTIARVMAENRKETAVYRAMGAKRSDIVVVYLIYSMIIALRIALFAMILGVAAAFMIDYFYGSQLTNIAVSSFGIMSDTMKFSLFDLSSPLHLAIIATIFIVSFIAILQPLIRNVTRPPIEDMRSE